MKIVDVADFYAPEGGGVKTYIHAKLRAAKRAGHELTVIAPGTDDGREEKEGGTIRWVKSPRVPMDPRYGLLVHKAKLFAALDEERPDLIEASSPWLSAWHVAAYPGDVPRVLVYHSDPVAVFGHTFLDWALSPRWVDRLAFPYWMYIRSLARNYQAVICGSRYMGQRLEAQKVEGALAVPFGIDALTFQSASRLPEAELAKERARLRSLCGAGEQEGPLFVSLSRHHFEKRLPVVLRGFEIYKRSNPGAALVLFGDGPSRKQIEREAARVGNVYVAGLVQGREALATSLAAADALLHGSAAETFGLAVAEGMSAAVPAVIPDRGAVVDFIESGGAIPYAAGSARGLAQALADCMARPATERRAMGEAARDTMRSLDQHFEHLFSSYAQIVKS